MNRHTKNQCNNKFKLIKQNNELESVEEGVVTNSIKDKIESFPNDDIYTDDDYNDDENYEKDRIIGFK